MSDSTKITMRKWRLGFAIATLFGFLTAGAGLFGDMGWRSFIAVLCTALLTNLGSYLMKHPVEEITDTTYFQDKPDKDTTKPPAV